MWILAYFLGLFLARVFLVEVVRGGEPGTRLSTLKPVLALGLQGLAVILLIGLLGLWITAWRRERVLAARHTGLPVDRAFSLPPGSLFKNWRLNWILIMVLGGWLVQLLFLLSSVSPLLSKVDQEVNLRGSVSGEPVVREGKITLTIQLREWQSPGQAGRNRKTGWIPGSGGLQVTAPFRGSQLEHGDLVQVSGLLTRPKRATVPGQFDYRNYLAHRGIYLQLKGEELQKIREGSGISLTRAALAIRRNLSGTLTEFFPGQKGQVLAGLVLGSTGSLDPELRETFNATGLGHLLSVSGFHVALVAGFFVALGRRLGWRTGITYWSTIAGVIIYSLISGLSPPVIRSAVMAGLGLYALLFNQRRSWPVALGLAGIVTTINRPEVILEPGYQLSFAATWAILTLTKDLTHLLRNIPRVPLWLGTGIAVPLAAQLGTWPLLAYHFNQFAPWSLLANLLLVEVAGLMLLLGLFMAILALVSYQAAAILQWGLGLLTSLFIGSANWLAGLPGGVINLPSPPLWSIVSYYLLLLMAGTSQGRFLLQRSWKLWLFHRPNARPVLLTSAGLAGVLLLVIITGSYREPGLQVTFLDVGEGDSIFIRTPGGRSLLIDAGPVQLNREGKVIYDAGARAVLPFLRSQGVNHLDLVIISHLHRDHVGGLPEVVQHIKVDNLLLPPLTGDSPEEKSIRRLALTNQIKLLQGQEGQRVNLDQAVELSILGPWEELISPAQAEADREQRLNNQSLVLQLAYGKHNYLFTGDIDSAVLEKLADNKKLGRLTLLKLPHHGSGYSLSTSFLEVTRPELGVISVGPNYYGHPSSKVLRYFQDTGIPLLRTDKQGALHISDFGGELKVITFNSPEG